MLLNIEARSLALGFVWGLQTAGRGSLDASFALYFSEAYASLNELFHADKTCYMPSVYDAWLMWSNSGCLLYHNNVGVLCEITTKSAADTTILVDRERVAPS